MLGTIFNAFSGLTNVSRRLQNNANNLSNVLTSGFKKSRVNIVDITEEMVDQISTKATFKSNVKVIKANDKMLGSLLDIKS